MPCIQYNEIYNSIRLKFQNTRLVVSEAAREEVTAQGVWANIYSRPSTDGAKPPLPWRDKHKGVTTLL